MTAFERDELLLVPAERFVADQTREEIAWNFVHGQLTRETKRRAIFAALPNEFLSRACDSLDIVAYHAA